jgi:fused signal recognition particle receptor
VRVTFQQALTKTRGGFLSRLFGRRAEEPITPEFVDELEEALLRADLSVSLVDPLMAQIRDLVTTGELKTVPKALEAVRDVLVAELAAKDASLHTTTTRPRVILVVGVNGSGKTTTAAKLAKRLKDEGETPLLAAADTFRAAAIEQLEAWAGRVGVPIVSGRPDGDPAAVVFDAVTAANARGNTTVIADTAGRLHTKGHLMDELGKIVRVTGRAREGAPDEVLLVLDGTAGQNAIQQARQFTKDASVTGLVVTKLDGTAKGGAVFAIVHELGLPVKFLGVGEKAEDLVPMDPRAFVDALLPKGPAPSTGGL